MKRRESQRVEFKESWQDEYLKWVCGFANAQGGVIYIGVNDDGDACDAAKAPRPKFTLHPYDFMISFEANPAGVLTGRQGDQSGDQSGVANNGMQLSEQILNALQKDPKRSLVSLASSLGVSPKTIKQYVARLKEKGALHRIGGTRGHWEVAK